MSNLYQLERNRLKLYGEMVKNDILERRKSELMQRQERRKRDSQELEQHIENTKRYEMSKKLELKELNNSLRQDNMLLSSLKYSMTPQYPQDNRDFIKEIHQLDVKRLDKLKRQLSQQARDNNTQAAIHKVIQEKLREIQKMEDERHKMRTKQMQMESIRNYEDIKRKHQQNMSLFQAHKRLVEENQKYKSEIEAFTNVDNGILQRYQRNEYMQRRAAMTKNQEVIKQQMQELQRRKNQDMFEYKKSVGDLENSMLKNVLVKPERNEAQFYSMDLKSQMRESSLRKSEEKKQKRQKIQINNIFGGVHGQQREKMINYIDKRLGIAQLERKKTTNSGYLDNLNKTMEQRNNKADNPQKVGIQPKNQERQMNKSYDFTSQSKGSVLKNQEYNQKPEQKNNETYSNSSKRYYKSYDPISGKNRLYAAD